MIPALNAIDCTSIARVPILRVGFYCTSIARVPASLKAGARLSVACVPVKRIADDSAIARVIALTVGTEIDVSHGSRTGRLALWKRFVYSSFNQFVHQSYVFAIDAVKSLMSE